MSTLACKVNSVADTPAGEASDASAATASVDAATAMASALPVTDAVAANAMPEPPEPPKKPEYTWQEPVTIAELTVSCAWKPENTEGGQPMLCDDGTFEQSCVPDSCARILETCRPKCAATCTSCARTCVSACDSCKATCKDDACRAACATKTAACEDSCLAGKETCRTNKCDVQHAVCLGNRKAVWDAHDCGKRCKTLNECTAACIGDSGEGLSFTSKCALACRRTFSKTCPADEAGGCLFLGTDPYAQ